MQSTQEPRASFVLCTRNRAKFLERALENARKFVTPRDELHIIDGLSTDNTREVVERYGDIVTSFESTKSGLAHAYNIGFLKANGRIIMNLTDDDDFFADGVTQAIEIMEAHPEVDALLCGGVYSRYDDATSTIHDFGFQYLAPGNTFAGDVLHLFTDTTGGFLILKRRVLSLVGLLDTTMQAADTDYMSRLMLCGANFKFLNVKVFRHVEYKHSSQLNRQQSNVELIRILVRHGQWNRMLNYNWEEIVAALNLDPVADASTYKRLSRATLRIAFLTVNNRAFRLLQQVFQLRSRPRALLGKIAARLRPSEGDRLPLTPTEPVWDATLR